MQNLAVRELLAGGIYHSGLLGALRQFAKKWELCKYGGAFPRRASAEPRFVILSYHRVGLEGVPLYSKLPPRVFEAQMRHLSRNYRVLSLEKLLVELENPTSAEPGVAVTFDDGYADLFEHAFPALKKYQIPATIFAIAEGIETGMAPWYDRLFLGLEVYPKSTITIELDTPTELSLENSAARLAATKRVVDWLRKRPDSARLEYCAALAKRLPVPENELQKRMLSWEQLKVMQAHRISCGSHTVTHPVLSRLDREQRTRELRDSREILERHLGRPVLDFAFPFGQPDDCFDVAESELELCGYRSAVTTTPGVNRRGANRYALRRVSIGEQRSLPLFAYWLNSLFLRRESATPYSSAPIATGIAAAVTAQGDER